MTNRANQNWPVEEVIEIQPGMITPWQRLQATSISHANALGVKHFMGRHTPPEVIRENCEILGRGNDEEIKARLMWYLTFCPKHWTGSRK